jgi:hypothetical protein
MQVLEILMSFARLTQLHTPTFLLFNGRNKEAYTLLLAHQLEQCSFGMFIKESSFVQWMDTLIVWARCRGTAILFHPGDATAQL